MLTDLIEERAKQLVEPDHQPSQDRLVPIPTSELVHDAVSDDRIRASFNDQLDSEIDEVVLVLEAPQHIFIDLHRINVRKSILV